MSEPTRNERRNHLTSLSTDQLDDIMMENYANEISDMKSGELRELLWDAYKDGLRALSAMTREEKIRDILEAEGYDDEIKPGPKPS